MTRTLILATEKQFNYCRGKFGADSLENANSNVMAMVDKGIPCISFLDYALVTRDVWGFHIIDITHLGNDIDRWTRKVRKYTKMDGYLKI